MKKSEKLNLISNIDSFDPLLMDLAVSDDFEDVRLTAVDKLSEFAEQGEAVSDYIKIALNDRSETVRDAAFSVIDTLDKKNIILDLLDTAINTPYPESRIKAVKYFISSDATQEDLRYMMPKVLSDSNKEIRSWALATADFIWDRDFLSENDAISFISTY